MDYLRHLADDIGSRPAGTENELAAAEYIRDTLASFGYEAALQAFPVSAYTNVSLSLDLLSPEQRSLEAAVPPSGSLGSAEAEVVAAGLGRPGDFPGNTGGRIVLVERGEITFAEKFRNAADAGATGVILYNNEPGIIGGSFRGGGLPGVMVSQEDGQALAAMLASGPVSARLQVNGDETAADSHNVIAKAPGSDCRVLAGGHYDTVSAGPGANDNASGTSVAIEMARTLAARGTPEHVCYTLFGAEEAGLLGSAFYVSSLTQAERDAIVAVLNFDMLGVGDVWPLSGSEVVVDVAAAEAEEMGLPYTRSSDPPGVGSDHASFIQDGVPAILFNCFCDPNYHTAGDRSEFIQPQRLAEAGNLGLGMIERLLGGG